MDEFLGINKRNIKIKLDITNKNFKKIEPIYNSGETRQDSWIKFISLFVDCPLLKEDIDDESEFFILIINKGDIFDFFLSSEEGEYRFIFIKAKIFFQDILILKRKKSDKSNYLTIFNIWNKNISNINEIDNNYVDDILPFIYIYRDLINYNVIGKMSIYPIDFFYVLKRLVSENKLINLICFDVLSLKRINIEDRFIKDSILKIQEKKSNLVKKINGERIVITQTKQSLKKNNFILELLTETKNCVWKVNINNIRLIIDDLFLEHVVLFFKILNLDKDVNETLLSLNGVFHSDWIKYFYFSNEYVFTFSLINDETKENVIFNARLSEQEAKKFVFDGNGHISKIFNPNIESENYNNDIELIVSNSFYVKHLNNVFFSNLYKKSNKIDSTEGKKYFNEILILQQKNLIINSISRKYNENNENNIIVFEDIKNVKIDINIWLDVVSYCEKDRYLIHKENISNNDEKNGFFFRLKKEKFYVFKQKSSYSFGKYAFLNKNSLQQEEIHHDFDSEITFSAKFVGDGTFIFSIKTGNIYCLEGNGDKTINLTNFMFICNNNINDTDLQKNISEEAEIKKTCKYCDEKKIVCIKKGDKKKDRYDYYSDGFLLFFWIFCIVFFLNQIF